MFFSKKSIRKVSISFWKASIWSEEDCIREGSLPKSFWVRIKVIYKVGFTKNFRLASIYQQSRILRHYANTHSLTLSDKKPIFPEIKAAIFRKSSPPRPLPYIRVPILKKYYLYVGETRNYKILRCSSLCFGVDFG